METTQERATVTVDEESPEPAPPSIGSVYTDEYDRLVRVAYLLTGSSAVAEDVVQDSFLRLHDHWSRVRQPAAYLRVAVVNGCRAHHRRTIRERSHFPELVTHTVMWETPIVLDALAELPYRQRVALVLRFYEDRADPEIAQVLGCRPATVRSLVHRGLAALRKVIDR